MIVCIYSWTPGGSRSIWRSGVRVTVISEFVCLILVNIELQMMFSSGNFYQKWTNHSAGGSVVISAVLHFQN